MIKIHCRNLTETTGRRIVTEKKIFNTMKDSEEALYCVTLVQDKFIL